MSNPLLAHDARSSIASMAPSYSDNAALRYAAQGDAALATIVAITGTYSRRVGAQLAIQGELKAGSLADGCLEAEIAHQLSLPRTKPGPVCLRYGAGSPFIDFRLPCGAGLDILLDPRPDKTALQGAVQTLDARRLASISLPVEDDQHLAQRVYMPDLRLVVFGDGPEAEALQRQAAAFGAHVENHLTRGTRPSLALGQQPRDLTIDPWTAIVLLFHDHEWEDALLDWALSSEAFFIGAQGGRVTRDLRRERLLSRAWTDADISRISSPIGLIGHARDPQTLALSVLAEVVSAYEQLHPHRCVV